MANLKYNAILLLIEVTEVQGKGRSISVIGEAPSRDAREFRMADFSR